MNTNVVPYAPGPGDGEAFWGFGSLWTVKASAEQTGGSCTKGGGGRPENGLVFLWCL